jgi:hypothetical protein
MGRSNRLGINTVASVVLWPQEKEVEKAMMMLRVHFVWPLPLSAIGRISVVSLFPFSDTPVLLAVFEAVFEAVTVSIPPSLS